MSLIMEALKKSERERQAGAGTPARPPRGRGAPSSPPSEPASEPASELPATPPGWQRRLPWIAGGGAVVLAAIVAVVIFWPRSSAPPQPAPVAAVAPPSPASAPEPAPVPAQRDEPPPPEVKALAEALRPPPIPAEPLPPPAAPAESKPPPSVVAEAAPPRSIEPPSSVTTTMAAAPKALMPAADKPLSSTPTASPPAPAPTKRAVNPPSVPPPIVEQPRTIAERVAKTPPPEEEKPPSTAPSSFGQLAPPMPTGNAAPAAKPARKVASLPRLNDDATYVARGWTLIDRGDYDMAVGDFGEAVRLKPESGAAYLGRAWAQEKLGALDRAAEDYGRAAWLQPGNPEALFGRGYANFYLDQPAKAAEDFAAAVEKADPLLGRYGLLWLYAARQRAGGEAAAELMRRSRRFDLRDWPGPLIRFFLGEVDEAQVLAAANDRDAKRRQEKQCVAHFFLGQHALAKGRREQAVGHFRQAMATGATGYRQFDAARLELVRLGEMR
jgi:lipoprotein NlpI